MPVMPLPTTTLVRLVQFAKVNTPRLLTPVGTVMLVRLLQPKNAPEMLVTLSGIATLVRLMQLSSALLPRLVTVSGIVMLVRLVHSQNAMSPILVTGKPLIVSGMSTAPLGPVYFVIMMVPLFVV
jgi:hypothetical protein